MSRSYKKHVVEKHKNKLKRKYWNRKSRHDGVEYKKNMWNTVCDHITKLFKSDGEEYKQGKRK